MLETVGYIGLEDAEEGMNCGFGCAAHLIKAGYKVNLFDTNKGQVDKLVAKGGIACGSPKEVAEKSSVVFIMQYDTPDVENILFGKDGVVEGIKANSVVIDMSSILPEAEKKFGAKLQELGVELVDAPVNGGAYRSRHERSTLNMLVGGSDEAFKRVKPLLDIVARIIIHIGPTGTGQATKVATQMLNAIEIASLTEMFVYAYKAGCDVAQVREAMLLRWCDEGLIENHSMRAIQHEFNGFYLDEHRRDLRFALQGALDYDVSIPITAVVAQQFNAEAAEGGGMLDHCSVMKIAEKNANCTVEPGHLDPNVQETYEKMCRKKVANVLEYRGYPSAEFTVDDISSWG